MCARCKYSPRRRRLRSSSRTAAGRAAGFTVIEALVVLILMGFVTAVLAESLSRVFDLRTRFSAYLDSSAASEMTLAWLRRSTEALTPDFPEGEGRFQGKATEFSGVSLAAPGSDPGLPHRVAWRLDYNQSTRELRLENRVDRGSWIAVAAWPEKSGRFDYDGGDGRWVPEWPPAMVSPTIPQIPRLIRVVVGQGGDSWSTILVPYGQRLARQRTDTLQRSILPQ